MKKLTFKIKSCGECPRFNYHDDLCYETGNKIVFYLKKITEIPDWCPLEDCEEEDENTKRV